MAANIPPSDPPPAFGGEGGGYGLESRVARLEAGMEYVVRTLGEIRQDIRDLRGEFNGLRGDLRATTFWLGGGIAGSFVILLGAMAKGFGWL